MKIKKNIYEIAILIFYLKYRESFDKFNFNKQIDLEPIHLLEIVPEFLKNFKKKMMDKINIMLDLKKYKI